MKKIFYLILIFISGVGGGIFADQILWPYFVERPLFYEYGLDGRNVEVIEREEIIIEENTALQNSVSQIEKAVVGVRTETASGIIQGSGLIITADGLMITFSDLIPKKGDFSFSIEGETPSYQVLKRDEDKNLALLKLDKEDLTTVGFAEFGSLRFGQKVFLVGKNIEKGGVVETVNEGIIKRYNSNIIETNILESQNLKGSPLFNIKGLLVGLVLVDSYSQVSAIPVSKIREFTGF